jgi:hypothetical protein
VGDRPAPPVGRAGWWPGWRRRIARRYDIDPVLVRIGFVVAAFSGIGAALYIAGWIALPARDTGAGAGTSRRAAA